MINSQSYSNNGIFSVLEATEELHKLKDVDTILDEVLKVSRKISRADAGSIFLVEGNRLRFSYVQNDTLFHEDESTAALYEDYTIPINDESLVGYAALFGKIIVIEDAYNMPTDTPYMFDHSFDERSGYRTISVLAIPLKDFENKVVGVMQLINAKDEEGCVIPFTKIKQEHIELFANNAAMAIERGIMNREMVLRMVKMAELRDPAETGAHVQRVGAFAAEIYQRWAMNNNIPRRQMKRTRDSIRIAAMLHDVGKVGISDAILKKPAKLTPEEYNTMKWHTIYGARLFAEGASDLDRMCMEIALNHHEKWDGTGYPGYIPDIMMPDISMGTPKRSDAIPLFAHITALADVFDALSSKRSYKDPWPEEKIVETLEAESGKHFNPEIVITFFQIIDVIRAIQERFK